MKTREIWSSRPVRGPARVLEATTAARHTGAGVERAWQAEDAQMPHVERPGVGKGVSHHWC